MTFFSQKSHRHYFDLLTLTNPGKFIPKLTPFMLVFFQEVHLDSKILDYFLDVQRTNRIQASAHHSQTPTPSAYFRLFREPTSHTAQRSLSIDFRPRWTFFCIDQSDHPICSTLISWLVFGFSLQFFFDFYSLKNTCA